MSVGPRDRDEAGRPRNSRPRDATGRPLDRGATGGVPVPELSADALARSPAEALAEAEQRLSADRPFEAHEVLEAQWKQQRDGGSEHAAMWQGLAQLAVGLTHLQRGNAIGAVTLLRRGAATIEPFAGPAPHGVGIDALTRWARSLSAQVQAGSGDAAATARDRPPLIDPGRC